MLELSSNRICLRTIENKDLKPLWELKYNDEYPEWAKWDGPYHGFNKLW